MPAVQAMVDNANERFSREKIKGITDKERESLQQGPNARAENLAQAVESLQIMRGTPGQKAAQAEELRKIPPGLLEVLRAAAYYALKQNPRVPVTFVWFEGHYELTISEVPATDVGPGGMSIVLRTPLGTGQQARPRQ